MAPLRLPEVLHLIVQFHVRRHTVGFESVVGFYPKGRKDRRNRVHDLRSLPNFSPSYEALDPRPLP